MVYNKKSRFLQSETLCKALVASVATRESLPEEMHENCLGQCALASSLLHRNRVVSQFDFCPRLHVGFSINLKMTTLFRVKRANFKVKSG